jgi:catechol 2,3-dioxygenase-like lactoylglutathione lyase family enzyme
MSRVQLALNVSDLSAAVEFYSKLFGESPAKVRPGYANFAIADPPLKLVLIENAELRGRGLDNGINHLGIEVETSHEVQTAAARLTSEGLATDIHELTNCCYSVQDKALVNDPDSAPWEIYTVLADAPADSTIGCGEDSCSPGRPLIEVSGRPPQSESCC